MPLRTIRNVHGIKQHVLLAYHIAKFNLKKDSVKTYTGVLWWLAEPGLNALIYWFLIVVVFKSGQDDFVPFALLGLVVWRWMQKAIIRGSTALQSNAALMRSIHMPKLTFVLKEVFIETFHFFCGLIVILAVYHLLGYYANLNYIFLPLQFATAFIFVLCWAMLLSAIVPFVPDLPLFFSHLFRILMFVSGVFYSAERLPERFRFIYNLNPLVPLVEGFRSIMMYKQAPPLLTLLCAAGFSMIAGLIGIGLHQKYNRLYPRILRI